MLQIAVYLGYNKIYLLGMDNKYPIAYDESRNIVEHKSLNSHFYEIGRPKKEIADTAGMVKAYFAARRYAEAHGIKIINATRGGYLEVFDREGLENIILDKSYFTGW